MKFLTLLVTAMICASAAADLPATATLRREYRGVYIYSLKKVTAKAISKDEGVLSFHLKIEGNTCGDAYSTFGSIWNFQEKGERLQLLTGSRKSTGAEMCAEYSVESNVVVNKRVYFGATGETTDFFIETNEGNKQIVATKKDGKISIQINKAL